MMTIGPFSERTGLPPKTLRYYEEVGLLIPVIRLENGYRQYSDEQVEKAQLISSLRQAGVTLADIRDFLESDPMRKEQLLSRWREEAAAKLLSIEVANQFLNGLDAMTKHVHLMYWDRPRTIIWFPVDAMNSTQEWNVEAQNCHRKLIESGLEAERSSYVRFHDSEERTRGELGFVINGKGMTSSGKVEAYSPTLFATLECHANMPLPCKPIFSTVRRFGFRPVGTPLRKYSDFSAFLQERYLLMVPVVHY